jgi:hypothetical protein
MRTGVTEINEISRKITEIEQLIPGLIHAQNDVIQKANDIDAKNYNEELLRNN